MSADALSWAMSQKGLKPSAKLLLIRLADVEVCGRVHYSPTFATWCSLSPDKFERRLLDLSRRGLITISAGVYTLQMGAGS